MGRKSRVRTLPPETFLNPINVLDFGNPEIDPCFGKLYDLTASECQACGDFELCGVIYAAKLGKERIKLESSTEVKDLEMDNLNLIKDIRNFFNSSVDSGSSRIRALKQTSTKFRLPLSRIKQILLIKYK